MIQTPDEFTSASEKLKEIKAHQKILEGYRKSMTQPIDVAKKMILDFFRSPEEKLASAERILKSALIGYEEEQEKERREAQRLLDEKAEKERQSMLKKAESLREKGKEEKADILEAKSALVSAPLAQANKPQVAGQSIQTLYDFEILDPLLIPREYLLVDEVKIRKVVKALKEDTRIPGIKVITKKSLSSRI